MKLINLCISPLIFSLQMPIGKYKRGLSLPLKRSSSSIALNLWFWTFLSFFEVGLKIGLRELSPWCKSIFAFCFLSWRLNQFVSNRFQSQGLLKSHDWPRQHTWSIFRKKVIFFHPLDFLSFNGNHCKIEPAVDLLGPFWPPSHSLGSRQNN